MLVEDEQRIMFLTEMALPILTKFRTDRALPNRENPLIENEDPKDTASKMEILLLIRDCLVLAILKAELNRQNERRLKLDPSVTKPKMLHADAIRE
jgi:hypothetical protein